MILLATSLALAPAVADAWPADQEVPAVPYPKLVEVAQSAAGFVPSGWKIGGSASGDLDGDGQADLALVLQKADPGNLIRRWEGSDERFDSNPRLLLVAFRQQSGGYRRIATDHQLIARLTTGTMDDPFGEVAIDKGVLRVNLHLFMNAGGWWTGNYKFKFRWQGGALRLIGYDRNGFGRNTHAADGLSINYLTGVKISSGTGPDESKPWSKRQRILSGPHLRLGEIGNGLEFDPK